MKVKVVRNWADASKAWIDVQTYTGLKLPPPEMQYKLSFMDKDSVPAQMIVTSDGVSWVDGLGGGYKGKTVLDMTIEEPQVGSGGGSCFTPFYDDVQITNILADGVNTTTVTFLLNGEQITNSAWLIYKISTKEYEYNYEVVEDGTVDIVTGQAGAPEYRLYIFLTTGEVKILDLYNEPSVPG